MRISAPQVIEPPPKKSHRNRIRRRPVAIWLRRFLAPLLSTALMLVIGLPQSYCGEHASVGILRGLTTAANPQGQPLIIGGVRLKLTRTTAGSTVLNAFSDNTGAYEFPDLQPGTYTFEASLQGFSTVVKTVTISAGQRVVLNIEMDLEKIRQQVEVRGTASSVSEQSSSPPATMTSQQLRTLPVPPERFMNVLPLVPGVIRTLNGKFNFKGETENQGMLLVDGTQMVDPITGSFAINIPVDAIQNVNVYKAPDDAEYGSFSGGLTSVQTKPPQERWNYSLHDFLPGLRGRSGHLVGISDAIPRLVFGGPLMKGKINFSENFQYEINKVPIRGLAWPHNETKTQGFDSFTTIQAILSPQHLLTGTVNVFPLRKQFADINALVPQTASSNYEQRGFSISAADSYQFTSGALLTTAFTYIKFDGYAHGQGPADMGITPDGWSGNFFNSWTRFGDEEQALPVFELPEMQWYGRHDFKVGVDFVRRSYTGTSRSRPVRLLREDGTPAGSIDFSRGGSLAGKDTDISEFAQDHWSFGKGVALDLGLRLTTQSRGRSAAVAPRAGLVYSPGSDSKTIFRTGGGLFYDRIPLLATDFTENPTRTLSFFDANGVMTVAPITLTNAYLRSESSQPRVRGGTIDLGTSPRNFAWKFEVDRELDSHIVLLASYLYSETHHQFVVTPLTTRAGAGYLALMPSGGSHYREFEVGARYHPNHRDVLNVSYVNSRVRGDLNTLANIFVPFEVPVIRPNVVSNLNSDIPNRLVAWGIFHLPLGFTFSPVVDVHTGFRYSNVDVLQNYVGTPNSQHFPTYLSFDWKVSRDFSLPFFLKNLIHSKVGLGIYYTDFTDRRNPLQVFNNTASPNFGQFVGFQHRLAGFVIDIDK